MRRMRITPIGTPSRSSGVARMVRVPVDSCSGLATGYSSTAAARSCTCTVHRSSTARPVTSSRVIRCRSFRGSLRMVP